MIHDSDGPRASNGRLLRKITAACAVLIACPAVAGVTTDGSLGPVQSLSGQMTIPQSLAAPVGSNLFHSFSAFTIDPGESATFTATQPFNNVVSRVTGGSPSSINGPLTSTIMNSTGGGADFWFINPAGIVFGAGASLQVPGAFHASTADYLKLGDCASAAATCGQFNATSPAGSSLAVATPTSFGFLGPTPAGISVNSATLQPNPGAALSLIGGPISTSGATLRANGGTIHLDSVAGPGEIAVDLTDQAAVTVTQFGNLSLTNNSTVIADGPTAGRVFIRGGALLVDASTVTSNQTGSDTGGDVTLTGTDSVSLSSGTTVAIHNQGPGNSGSLSVFGGDISMGGGSTTGLLTSVTNTTGDINVTGDSLTLAGAAISSETLGPGQAGNVNVTIDGDITLDDSQTPYLNTSITSTSGSLTSSAATGNAGTVNVQGNSLTLTGAGVGSETFGAGQAGDVNVTVAGALTIDGSQTPDLNTAIFSRSSHEFRDITAGDAGTVTVQAGPITILGAGSIDSTTFGAGNAGNVTVTADGPLLIDGKGLLNNSSDLSPNGIGSNSDDPFCSPCESAGAVTVQASDVTIRGGGEIRAGAINLQASGLLLIDNSNNLGRFSKETGILADSIWVEAEQITILSGGTISSSNAGGTGTANAKVSGLLLIDNSANVGDPRVTSIYADTISVEAGQITLKPGGAIGGIAMSVTARGLLLIDGDGYGDCCQGPELPGIFVQPAMGALANAVTVNAGQIKILNGGQITSQEAFGSGNGGNITLTTSGELLIDDSTNLLRNRPVPTGIFAGTGPPPDPQDEAAPGNAGAINVQAGQITIRGGQINAGTQNTNNGGTITVSTSGTLIIDNTIPNNVYQDIFHEPDSLLPTYPGFSGISTNSDQPYNYNNWPPGGAAGSVSITADQIFIVGNGARISSSTNGSGNAGDVMVSATQLTLKQQGQIAAAQESQVDYDRTADGAVGTITLRVDSLEIEDGAQVTAANPGQGAGGAVNVTGLRPGSAATQVTISGVAADRYGTPISDDFDQLIRSGLISSSTGYGTAGQTIIIGPFSEPITLIGPGSAGSVTVTANAVKVANRGQIAASTLDGGSGDITLNVGTLDIESAGQVTVATLGMGQGGSVIVEGVTPGSAATDVTISGVAVDRFGNPILDNFGQLIPSRLISSSTDNRSTAGAAGSVAITADTVTVANQGQMSAANVGGAGGQVTLNAELLQVHSGGQVTAATSGAGNGGRVTVNGIDGGSPLLVAVDGGSINTTASSTGAAGQVVVNGADSVTVTGGSLSSSSTGTGAGAGNAGNVTVTATRLELNQQGQIAASTVDGAGSTVTLNVDTLQISGGAQVTAATSGAGTAGDVTVRGSQSAGLEVNDANLKPSDSLVISGPGSGLFSNSTGGGQATGLSVAAGALPLDAGSAGAAGTVNVYANTILLEDQGAISVSSAHSGAGSAILKGAALRLIDSSIDATARESLAGNVDLTFTDQVYLTRSTISGESASATEAGGNFQVGSGNSGSPLKSLILEQGSLIKASSASEQSGKAFIAAEAIAIDSSSTVQATGGVFTVGSVLGQALLIEDPQLVDASGELATHCTSQEIENRSSLIVRTTRSLPLPSDSVALSGSPVARAAAAIPCGSSAALQ